MKLWSKPMVSSLGVQKTKDFPVEYKKQKIFQYKEGIYAKDVVKTMDLKKLKNVQNADQQI